MFAKRTATGQHAARAVVAAWLIAVQLLLTASVGAVFSRAGNTGDDVRQSHLPSTPMPMSSNEDYVTAAVAAAGDAAAADGGMELEVAILDMQTGELALGARAATPMLSASLSKLILAVDIIDRRRDEGLLVDEAAIERIRQALGPSDDTAMTELWSGFDGPGSIDRVGRRLGSAGMLGADDSSAWGEVSITAADIAQLYRYVLTMPKSDRRLIMDALAAAPVVAADGFAQDFGLLAPGRAGFAVAKQGWMCCWGDTAYLHSAGVVGDDERFVVVLLSRQQFEPDWKLARDRLTAVATAVNHALGTDAGLVS